MRLSDTEQVDAEQPEAGRPDTGRRGGEPAAGSDPRAGKYLTFRLGAEVFAVPVSKVREIIEMQTITRVPQTAGHVKGVINLRGKVIPVVDPRLKLSLSESGGGRQCIIVVEAPGAQGPALTGLVVDAVNEVAAITGERIEDVPDFGDRAAAPYLLGIAKLAGGVRMLLDIDAVLAAREEPLSPAALFGGEQPGDANEPAGSGEAAN